MAGRRLVAASPPRVSAIAPAHRPCGPSGPSAVHDWQKEGWRKRVEVSFRSGSPRRVARSTKKEKKDSTRQNGLLVVGEHACEFAHVYSFSAAFISLSLSLSLSHTLSFSRIIDSQRHASVGSVKKERERNETRKVMSKRKTTRSRVRPVSRSKKHRQNVFIKTPSRAT